MRDGVKRETSDVKREKVNVCDSRYTGQIGAHSEAQENFFLEMRGEPRFNSTHSMNSASHNFPLHLGALRERTLHPTDYELALNYFLEEFAGDAAFVKASDRQPMPHLVAILGQIVSQTLGQPVELDGALVSYLREHRFVHGNAQAKGRIVIFFYFEEVDAGLVMLMPGIRGEADVMRFRTGGLIDPQKN